MAEMWHPAPIEVYKDWVGTIIDEALDELSEWESIFIESINRRLESGLNLTQLQADKLESIYADKTK